MADLDALDGTPVLGIKPYLREFAPQDEVRQAPLGNQPDASVLLKLDRGPRKISSHRTGRLKARLPHVQLCRARYHTARFRLVPSLAKALTVVTPPIRKPGTPWVELPRPASSGAELSGHIRIGYARASTARQSLDTQLDSLTAAGVTKIFSEKISTRAVSRPELDRAVEFARELRAASLGVTLVVHEHKRLGRGLALAELAEQLKSYGVALEFLMATAGVITAAAGAAPDAWRRVLALMIQSFQAPARAPLPAPPEHTALYRAMINLGRADPASRESAGGS